jgi:hypothetical protein
MDRYLSWFWLCYFNLPLILLLAAAKNGLHRDVADTFRKP